MMNRHSLSLFSFLKQNNFEVSNTSKTITFKKIKKYNLIISYGYKKKINSEIIKKIKN